MVFGCMQTVGVVAKTPDGGDRGATGLPNPENAVFAINFDRAVVPRPSLAGGVATASFVFQFDLVAWPTGIRLRPPLRHHSRLRYAPRRARPGAECQAWC